MKRRTEKIMAALLAAALLTTLLAGCGNAGRAMAGEGHVKPQKGFLAAFFEPARKTSIGKDSGFTAFDTALIDHLAAEGCGEESFLVSPLSLRAALALAALGAEGETKEELLQAMGFADEEEMLDWYAAVLASTDIFEEEARKHREWIDSLAESLFSEVRGTDTERVYRVVNSLWGNEQYFGEFRDDYVQRAAALRAAASRVPAEEITDAVNSWVNEQTQGMIPEMVKDLSKVSGALVNALYLRTAWEDEFFVLGEDVFITARDEKTTMEFMARHDDLLYYEDGKTQLVVLPLRGNMKIAFVLGSTEDIRGKLDKAEYEDVVVTIPKFELETELTDRELVRFLEAQGAVLPVSEGEADFSAMFEEQFWPDGRPVTWYIGDIIQKSKLKLDEDGIEAAAATVVEMYPSAGAMPGDPPKPKIFTADRPFAFYLYSDYSGLHDFPPYDACGEEPELLFFGQYLG